MSLTTAGKNATNTKPTPPSSSFIIRRAHLTEGYRTGWIAAKTYHDSNHISYLSPHRERYPDDYIRAFQQRQTRRMFNPRNVTLVAAEKSNPSVAIGYAQFFREGEDAGAKRQIARGRSVWTWFLAWVFWAYWTAGRILIGGDRSSDPAAQKVFAATGERDLEIHFKGRPERENRWYVQNCVVLSEFQGRGVGKLLMREVMARAEEEGVPVSLKASAQGEKLYERLGFKVLGRFSTRAPGDDSMEGGIMMYTPSTWRGEERQT